MSIDAKLVKTLRERTGAGMMDCKKALVESKGDLDLAVDFLRKSGIAKAEKKSSRDANEGLVVSYIHHGSKLGVLLEMGCETDFVAKTDGFLELANNVAMQIFTKDGPLAFLPLSNSQTSIVFSCKSSHKIQKQEIKKIIKKFNNKYEIKKF